MSKVFQSPSLRALSGVFSGALSVVPSSLPSDVFIFVSFALSYASPVAPLPPRFNGQEFAFVCIFNCTFERILKMRPIYALISKLKYIFWDIYDFVA